MRRPVIELRAAGRVFPRGPGVIAVDGVTLSVDDDEFLAVSGPSGCGKSTLLALMGCLDLPTSGRVLIAGQDVTEMRDHERTRVRADRIGFVFQQFHLVPFLSALANVELALLYRGLSRRDRRGRAAEALSQVGLADRLEHRPDELSGGEQQRVAIARALVTGPDVVLADEPTGNLDSESAALVLDVLNSVTQGARSLVVVTHSEAVASRADRVIRLRDGRIAAEEVTRAHRL